MACNYQVSEKTGKEDIYKNRCPLDTIDGKLSCMDCVFFNHTNKREEGGKPAKVASS